MTIRRSSWAMMELGTFSVTPSPVKHSTWGNWTTRESGLKPHEACSLVEKTWENAKIQWSKTI